jgi:hypothetical protein
MPNAKKPKATDTAFAIPPSALAFGLRHSQLTMTPNDPAGEALSA